MGEGMKHTYAVELEAVVRNGIERRGLENIACPGDLASAAEALVKSRRVMILTGFCVRSAMKGETDGPPGAVSLAGALKALGKEVVLVTDRFSGDLLEAGLEAKGLDVPVACVERDGVQATARLLMDRHRPDHLVSIERTGRAADGNSYSMRGEVLSDLIPQLDCFFEEASGRGIPTTAIGDGGNEIGMGKISKALRTAVYKGQVIWSETSCDHLIVASVSNWGAHALAAALGILQGKRLLHDADTEKAVLAAIVAAGSVDGCTRENVMTVDGLTLEENLNVVESLRAVVERHVTA